MSPTALILGPSGRFGRHAADAFWNAGWTIRRFDRARDDLMAAARGADLIVHGWNPPYPDWARDVPRQTVEVIAAARASGATVLIPGNVYVYGDRSPELMARDTPHGATNPLGRIRIAMEAAFREAGVPAILLRAGDFLDTAVSDSWFDRVIAKQLDRGVVTWPGAPEADHAWAYLPDMARAAVALAEMRDRLDRFEEVAFPGYTLTGLDLTRGIEAALGRALRLRRMNWLPLYLAAPVWPLARRLIEMRYLWSMPHRLDGTRMGELLPEFRATPLAEALARAVSVDLHPDQPVTRPLAV